MFSSDLTARKVPVHNDNGHDLVCSFVSGDRSAFDEIYRRYEEYVYNTCLGILGDPDDARDAMQETFVSVYQSLSKFRYDSKLSTWVYRAAVNKCLDLMRSRKSRGRNQSIEWLEDLGAPERDLLGEQSVRATLMKLKADYRILLVLHYFQGLSYEEISQAMNCSVNNVRINLHRARKAFRELYDDRRCRDEL